MEFLRTRRERRALSETTQSPYSTRSGDSVTAVTRTGSGEDQLPPLESGTRLHDERFVVKEVIGVGGEGVVYKAWDRSLEQHVALKTLHVSDPSHIPTIKREFRFLSDLSHPGLVQLHELVVDQQLSFFTMSLIEGGHFLKAATEGSSLRSLLGQLADVVSFLHSTGRVHRDIKATNILVRPDGRLVLLDFGVGLNLSRPINELKGPTGTPRYIAPELLQDEPASQESDAYSIGVLLYEALTGSHPSPTGRTEVDSPTPPRPSALNPTVATDLDDLCVALLHPNPKHRATVPSINETLGQYQRFGSQVFLRAPVSHGSFKGRNRELELLKDTYLQMQEAYAPILVMVEAKSGLGKTAFVEQFLGQNTDAVILRSKCSEHELVAHKAIDGIIDDLIDHLMTLDEETLSEVIPFEEAGILVQLFPELRRLKGLEDAPTLSPRLGEYRTMRLRAYLALAGVLGRLSDGCNLIIFVDDLQWGDADSGRLLREVFAGPERPHCLLILAYRSEEQAQSDCITELLDGPGGARAELKHSHITLGPLSKGDSRALVETLIGELDLSGDEVKSLVTEAEGSPLLLTELVSHRKDPTVAIGARGLGIDGILDHRIAQLSPEVCEAFTLICCAGTPLPVGLLNATVGCTSNEVLVALTHGRLGHIRQGGRALEVFHDSIREAMLRRIGSAAPRYHATLAQALANRRADAAEIARHFFAGGDPREGSLWAETAAEQANRSFALARAIELFRLALDVPDISKEREIHLKRRLALAFAAIGRGADAAPLFLELAQQASGLQATELRTQAACHFLICGDAEQGFSALADVHASVELAWPRTHREALRFFVWERMKLKLALKTSETGMIPLDTRQQAQMEACRAAMHLGFVSILHASGSSARFLRMAHRSGDRDAQVVGYGMEAIYRATSGAPQKAIVSELKERAKSYLSDSPSPYHQAFVYYVEGQCHYLLGEIKQSIIYYEKAEQGFLEEGRNVSWELNSARVMYSQALSMLGRLDVWSRRLNGWHTDAIERGDMCLMSACHIGLGRLEAMRNGKPQTGRIWVDEGTRQFLAPEGGTHYFAAQFALAFIDSYERNHEAVLSRIAKMRAEMSASHMTRVQIPRAHLAIQGAFSLINLAAEIPTMRARQPLLKKARSLAQRLKQEAAPWTDAFALLIRATCDLSIEESQEALNDLKRAIQLLAVLDLRLYWAAASVRLGEFVGGDEGRAYVADGSRHLLQLDIKEVDNTVAALAPKIRHP